jgi:hypothetical protein
MSQASEGVQRNKSSTMRAASVRHDFGLDDETGELAEQMGISERYKVETDSQDQNSVFRAAEAAIS